MDMSIFSWIFLALAAMLGAIGVFRCSCKIRKQTAIEDYRTLLQGYLALVDFYGKFSAQDSYPDESDLEGFSRSVKTLTPYLSEQQNDLLQRFIQNYNDDLLTFDVCCHAQTLGSLPVLAKDVTVEKLVAYKNQLAPLVFSIKKRLLSESETASGNGPERKSNRWPFLVSPQNNARILYRSNPQQRPAA